nr:Scr1 family TA system antitoxin-like transcriptional regulator [Nocardia sp. BMG51109]
MSNDLRESPVVFVESFAPGSLFLEEPRDVDRYRAALDSIRGVALDVEETRQLVLRIAEEFEAWTSA